MINRNSILSLALLVGCSGPTSQLAQPVQPAPEFTPPVEKAGPASSGAPRCHLSCCTPEVLVLQEKTAAETGDRSIANECCICEELVEPMQADDGPLKITFVDVDEGDAILIQVGQFDALIDTGNHGKWDGQLGRVLESVSGPLELLVLTHPHADHYGQADEVMAALEVERIITSGESRGPPRDDKQKAFFQDYLDALAAEGVTPEVGAIGTLPSPIAGLELEVLATGGQYTDGPDGSDINNDSLVLMLTYAGKKVLFAADIEDVAGAQLVAKHCGDTKPCPALNADVFKVPHHGSKHFDQGFFEAVSPRFAVISGGFHNEQHCLPRQESYQALKLLGAKVFSTSAEDNGDVSVVISPDGNMNWDFPDNPVFVWDSQQGRKCVGPMVFDQG